MTTLHTLVLLIALTLSGCQEQHISSHSLNERGFSDGQQFAEILGYYPKTFPGTSFADKQMVHMSDGPHGERLHINVPLAVNAEYRHGYNADFLAKQSKSADGLARMVAGELLLLQKELLFTYPSSIGYDGVQVDCIAYVVDDEQRGQHP